MMTRDGEKIHYCTGNIPFKENKNHEKNKEIAHKRLSMRSENLFSVDLDSWANHNNQIYIT